jgi:tetratricopeptide (TPR) repeat protein
MTQIHKNSYLILLLLTFLLPIFFIPGGALSIESAKSALLTLGLVVAVLVFLLEIWREKKLIIPWHFFVLVAILLPLVYLLSALLSTPSSLSLFGYNFEIGTFGHMLIGSSLLVLVSMVFIDTARVLKALTALFISFSLIAVFTTIKILSGGAPVWGTFFGNMGNSVGRWTDLATLLGLLAVFSILILTMIPVKKALRVLLYSAFVLSVILLAIIHFSTAFIFTLIFSIILIVYFSTVEKHFLNTGSASPESSERVVSKPTVLPIILALVSILFLINPTISATRGTLGDVVASRFGVVNTEVRPSFSATLSVSRAALSRDALLGSGPNTFSRDWLIHKPVDVNTTPFWSVAFPFGIGFIPTQIASTGILGTLLWIAFFVLIVFLGAKFLANIPESRASRFTLATSLVALLYLWIASFMYPLSGTMLMLAFIFSGLFVAVSQQAGIISARVINFSRSATTSFVSTLLVILFVLGSVAFGFMAFNKTASAFYFKKAVDLSNTPEATLEDLEAVILKAVSFAPADIHYVAISRINFVRAQRAAVNTEGTQESNLAVFQEAIPRSITAARLAVSINPGDYRNWLALGTIYSSLVPKPLSVEGAYENAKFAFSEAGVRNPANPEIPLFLAQLELNREDADTARSLIRESIALKEDYADAYLLMAQLEVRENNIASAITSAERLALLIPNNPAIYFELGLLNYTNKGYTKAVDAFSRALQFAPNYANAQYYLGLSLAQLGKLEESLEQFEALSLSNPESEEVKAILEELRAGEVFFLTPPVEN